MLRGVAALVVLLLSAGLACAKKRVALVIGNSAYTEVPRLALPEGDLRWTKRVGLRALTGLPVVLA